jgi:iron complex outermembrane receptor protein
VGVVLGAAGPDDLRIDIGTVRANGGLDDFNTPPAPPPIGTTPTTAAQQAPSQPPLTSTQPTSVIGPNYIRNNSVPTQNYDNLIKFSPSVANVEPTGAGLQQNFQQTIRGFRYTQFNNTFDDLVLAGTVSNLAPQTGAYFLAHDIASISVERGPGMASQIGYATFGGTVAATLVSPADTFGINPYGTWGSWGTHVEGLRIDSGAIAALGGARGMLDSEHVEGGGYTSGTSTLRNNFYGRIEAPIGDNTVITLVGMYNYARTHTPYGATQPQLQKFGASYALNFDPTSQAYTNNNVDNYYTDFDYIGVKSAFGDGWAIDNKTYTMSYYHNGTSGLDPNGTTPNLTNSVVLSNGRKANTGDVPGLAGHSDFRSWGNSFRISKDTRYGQARAGVWFDYTAASSYKYNIDFTAGGIAYTPRGNATPFNSLYNSNFITFQPYVEFAATPLPGLVVTPGLKYTNVTRSVDATYINKNGTPLNASQTWDKLLPSLDARYEIIKGWSVYVQWAKGFLAPPLNTVLVPSVNLPASLKPQTTTNYQVGTVFRNERFSAGMDVYYIRFDNYIVSHPNAAGSFFTNNGSAIFKGIELEGTVKIVDGVSLYANATVNDASYTGSNFPVAEVPRHTAAIGPVVQRDGAYFSILAKYVGPQYLLDQTTGGAALHPTVPIKCYTDVDMSAGYTWIIPNWNNRSLNIRGILLNVFNNHNLIGFQSTTAAGAALLLTNPGRGMFVSVSAAM